MNAELVTTTTKALPHAFALNWIIGFIAAGCSLAAMLLLWASVYTRYQARRQMKEEAKATELNWKLVRYWAHGLSVNGVDYFCPECGERLKNGPEGGCAMNAVCPSCNINYGTLPNRRYDEYPSL